MDRNTGQGPPEQNRQTKEAMAVQGAQEAMAVQGAQEAMAGGPCGRGLGPVTNSRNPYYPPKIFPWGSEGVSGALRG